MGNCGCRRGAIVDGARGDDALGNNIGAYDGDIDGHAAPDIGNAANLPIPQDRIDRTTKTVLPAGAEG